MRFIFKTGYDQDIDLARRRWPPFWYGLAAARAAGRALAAGRTGWPS
jgi:hypothetical protein